jgi:hypothetical protein
MSRSGGVRVVLVNRFRNGTRPVLSQGRVYGGPVAAGVQVHQRLGPHSDQFGKDRPLRQAQQRWGVAVGAVADVA